MTRSKKKTPYVGACAGSDRSSKTHAHHQERHAVKRALRQEKEIPDGKTFGDPWDGCKDGKIWLGDRYPEQLRK